MLKPSFSEARDILHAQLCYQLFITPIHLPLEKKYRQFAQRACEYFEEKRTEAIHLQFPRHHILHHFAQNNTPQAPKVLITHGWMSRAAYMVRLTQHLYHAGYDVYVLDFPAHGEAKGVQLTWTDATFILKNILNQFGPFYAVMGHSFGGSMLLNALNLSGQLPEWKIEQLPERTVLIASPTRMRSPVHQLARRYKLSGVAYQHLRDVIYHQAEVDPKLIRLQNFINQNNQLSVLCIHGEQDETVLPNESLIFCEKHPEARLEILSGADHVSVLMDERVEQMIHEFLESELEKKDRNQLILP